ncbi:hypothetical protein B0H14DRAFT_3871133 [Mycena olivaceomarginata]|nr:hypothetical protein B0H14DRAFT_3871133 [Mycena olivaceomarginata]
MSVLRSYTLALCFGQQVSRDNRLASHAPDVCRIWTTKRVFSPRKVYITLILLPALTELLRHFWYARYRPALPTPKYSSSASPLPSLSHPRNPAIAHADTVPEVARHSRSGTYDISHNHPRSYAHMLYARSTHTGDTMCAVDRTHSDHVGITIPEMTSRAAQLQYLACISPLHRGGLTTASTPARPSHHASPTTVIFIYLHATSMQPKRAQNTPAVCRNLAAS